MATQPITINTSVGAQASGTPPTTFVVSPTPVPAPTQVLVPVSSPLHPAHATWLQILLAVMQAAAAIGPTVVSIVDPGEAAVAGQLGQVTSGVIGGIQQQAL